MHTWIAEDTEPQMSAEYEGILRDLYPEDFVDSLAASDEAAAVYLGGRIRHEKHGDLLIRYVEGPEKVGVMGLLSKSGRVRPSDAKALKSWLSRLREALDGGKEVYVSLNERSRPLFMRALRGGNFHVESLSSHAFPFGVWETVRVTSNPDQSLEEQVIGIEVPYAKVPYAEVYAHPTQRQMLFCLKGGDCRGYLDGDRLIVWPPFDALHVTVSESLKLGPEAIPVYLYGHQGKVISVVVSDASKNSNWHHNPKVVDAILSHSELSRFFADENVDVSFWDEDIVGDWRKLSEMFHGEQTLIEVTWRDLIRGEWWLDKSGYAEFADIDVGEAGHEGIAIDHLLSGFSDEFAEEFENTPEKDRGEHIIRFLKHGESEDLSAAYHSNEIDSETGERVMGEVWGEMHKDARTAYMKRHGAIMVIDSNFAAWTIDAKSLKAMQSFLWEQIGEGVDALADGEIGVEEKSTGKWAQMPASDFLDLKGPRDIWRLSEDEELFTDPTGRFWGNAGAGGLFYAKDTGRYLVAKRSPAVNEPNTWGTWGGKLDGDETPEEALEREIEEEAGYTDEYSLQWLYTFEDGDFRFDNYLIIVPHEFEPKHSWETSGHRWVKAGEWPSPMHFGLKALIPHLTGE